MNKPYITAILAITSLTFNAATLAMSEDEFKSANKNIDSAHQSAKTACGSFTDNAKDICMAVARGNARVAKAELETRYQQSRNPA